MSAQAGLALRLAGAALALLLLGALANRLGVAANFSPSSAGCRSLLDRRVLRCLLAGAGGAVRSAGPVALVGRAARSSAPITPSAGALTEAPPRGHRRRP
jgi:hypothetical protein